VVTGIAFSIMASILFLLTAAYFVQVKSLYRQLDDNVTKYWASESKVPGDPIHSYDESKRFCESLAGWMPIGTPEEMEFLRSFLPLASYPYWLGQGSEFGTWSDGSPITTDFEPGYPPCETNCGIHYQAGKLVKISMDEKSRANIICKVAMNEFFFVRLLMTNRVQLSSDQIEVAMAADFARSFLTSGFNMGCFFAVMTFYAIIFVKAIVTRTWKCIKRYRTRTSYDGKDSEDREASEPLGTAFAQSPDFDTDKNRMSATVTGQPLHITE
jgi:hypothetical protein